ncbi:MAG: tetratricopeptide repeat protein [Gammaproteobacteria bacterium]|nr:tetratricopeptide repeat protein [Gammaproteobacteria bacterium]
MAIKPGEHEFHFALAKSYFRAGDPDKAQASFHEAQRLAGGGAAGERYRHPIAALLQRTDG